MVIHFEDLQKAEDHLTQNKWSKLKSGLWVSADKTCKATHATIPGSNKIAVFFTVI